MRSVWRHNKEVPVDPRKLPDSRSKLKRMVVDLSARNDTLEALLKSVIQVQVAPGRASEQLSRQQLALFEAQAREENKQSGGEDDNDDIDLPPPPAPPPSTNTPPTASRRGRQPLPEHLERERIERDLPEQEKHCDKCNRALKRFGEETSERLEYIPARWKVIEEVCFKYACGCTVRTATKPSQPLPKSLAGPSLLAQVIVSKWNDHLPLHRQSKMFARLGVAVNEQTMCDWMASCADLLSGLYAELKQHVLSSKVVGTDDTSVKVRVKGLDHTRSGRVWPYVGDGEHAGVIYDFTMDRSRAGPEKFLSGYRGYLQADAYSVYDPFFEKKHRGLTEVGCLAHARRHVLEALPTESRLQSVLHWIAKLYRVEKYARQYGVIGNALSALREKFTLPVVKRLCALLLRLRDDLLPKSAAGKAVNYLLKHWTALTRFAGDGDLEIDNNRKERAIRPWAIGRSNWTFFGSPKGGRTAAVLMSFVATCKLLAVDPYAWCCDVLSRIADHPQQRLAELLPHRWLEAKEV